jgi:hypothetical protein
MHCSYENPSYLVIFFSTDGLLHHKPLSLAENCSSVILSSSLFFLANNIASGTTLHCCQNLPFYIISKLSIWREQLMFILTLLGSHEECLALVQCVLHLHLGYPAAYS